MHGRIPEWLKKCYTWLNMVWTPFPLESASGNLALDFHRCCICCVLWIHSTFFLFLTRKLIVQHKRLKIRPCRHDETSNFRPCVLFIRILSDIVRDNLLFWLQSSEGRPNFIKVFLIKIVCRTSNWEHLQKFFCWCDRYVHVLLKFHFGNSTPRSFGDLDFNHPEWMLSLLSSFSVGRVNKTN